MRKQYNTGTRIVTRFLLIPRTINHELRWLELAKVEQHLKYDVKGKAFWVDSHWKN